MVAKLSRQYDSILLQLPPFIQLRMTCEVPIISPSMSGVYYTPTRLKCS